MYIVLQWGPLYYCVSGVTNLHARYTIVPPLRLDGGHLLLFKTTLVTIPAEPADERYTEINMPCSL